MSNEEISDVFFNDPALTELNEDEKTVARGFCHIIVVLK